MKRPSIPRKKTDPMDSGRFGAEFIIDRLFMALGESDVTYDDLSVAARVSVDALKKWRTKGTMPRLDIIVACFEVLGFELKPVHTGVVPGDYYPIDADWSALEEKRAAQSRR
jgi:hypothetical protein